MVLVAKVVIIHLDYGHTPNEILIQKKIIPFSTVAHLYVIDIFAFAFLSLVKNAKTTLRFVEAPLVKKKYLTRV